MHYYNGKNTIVPLPDGLRFDSNYMSKIKDTLELSRAMEKINTSAKSCILITDRMEPRFQNDADLKILNGYLTSHYNITFDTVFYGHSKSWPLRIRRLEKK